MLIEHGNPCLYRFESLEGRAQVIDTLDNRAKFETRAQPRVLQMCPDLIDDHAGGLKGSLSLLPSFRFRLELPCYTL